MAVEPAFDGVEAGLHGGVALEVGDGGGWGDTGLGNGGFVDGELGVGDVAEDCVCHVIISICSPK